MPGFRRPSTPVLPPFLVLAVLMSSGCGSPDVGCVQAGADGAKGVQSKTEGRFKESLPPKKAPRGKAGGADEGIESR